MVLLDHFANKSNTFLSLSPSLALPFPPNFLLGSPLPPSRIPGYRTSRYPGWVGLSWGQKEGREGTKHLWEVAVLDTSVICRSVEPDNNKNIYMLNRAT